MVLYTSLIQFAHRCKLAIVPERALCVHGVEALSPSLVSATAFSSVLCAHSASLHVSLFVFFCLFFFRFKVINPRFSFHQNAGAELFSLRSAEKSVDRGAKSTLSPHRLLILCWLNRCRHIGTYTAQSIYNCTVHCSET